MRRFLVYFSDVTKTVSTKTKTKTKTAGSKTKTKTKAPGRKTKTKTPKICLEAVSRRGSAPRHHITTDTFDDKTDQAVKVKKLNYLGAYLFAVIRGPLVNMYFPGQK